MGTTVETIANRDPSGRGFPPGPWLALASVAVLFVLVAALYFVAPWPGAQWLGWLYLLLALGYPLAAWGATITSFEVGSDRIRVHRHARSQSLPAAEILDVEAHRHWQSPFAQGRAPAYWLKVRRSSGWSWRLQYIDPAAGDRLLAALYRLKKPILVYNWQ